MRIDHPEFRSLPAESVLLIVALKVVDPIHAFLVEYNQTLIRGPAKLDDLPLVPLFVWNNSVPGIVNWRLGRTERIRRLSPAGEYNCI